MFLGGGSAATLLAATTGAARAQEFSIDAIDNWLRRNGGYSLNPIRREDTTGSVSP